MPLTSWWNHMAVINLIILAMSVVSRCKMGERHNSNKLGNSAEVTVIKNYVIISSLIELKVSSFPFT